MAIDFDEINLFSLDASKKLLNSIWLLKKTRSRLYLTVCFDAVQHNTIRELYKLHPQTADFTVEGSEQVKLQ